MIAGPTVAPRRATPLLDLCAEAHIRGMAHSGPMRAATQRPLLPIQAVPTSPRSRSGANDRAGFIEAPLIGAAHRPASAIYPPTAMAPLGPMLRAPEAVPRIVFTSPALCTTSIASTAVLMMR
jgi:hypothetical protein